MMARFDQGAYFSAENWRRKRSGVIFERPTMERVGVYPVEVRGSAADASEDVGRRGNRMCTKDCMRTAVSSVGDERAIFFVFFLEFLFTLDDSFQADNARLQILGRKGRCTGVPTSMNSVTSEGTSGSSPFT